MKIRSITCFVNPRWPLDEDLLEECARFMAEARPAFEAAGFEVQTARLATVPFSRFIPQVNGVEMVRLARSLEEAGERLGLQYISLGPALPENLTHYDVIPAVLEATQTVFMTGLITTAENELSMPAARLCARIIQQTAGISPDGFANLRFAALANVPAGSPFFPAAYSPPGKPSFALALEAADLAVQAASGASTLGEVRQRLIKAIENHADHLTVISTELESRFRFGFAGLDFTLAPFPAQDQSIGTALERLGLPSVGRHGSLAGVAFLADTLDRAQFRKSGFNGVMLPVLEDSVLAQRAADGVLTLKDLLLLSTVCGTGLDTIPLAGDTSVDQIYALLLDLAALALRANKPLTARLMPIPGKKTGDPTSFDFPFFANSRTMAIEADPLSSLLAGNESIPLEGRR